MKSISSRVTFEPRSTLVESEVSKTAIAAGELGIPSVQLPEISHWLERLPVQVLPRVTRGQMARINPRVRVKNPRLVFPQIKRGTTEIRNIKLTIEIKRWEF